MDNIEDKLKRLKYIHKLNSNPDILEELKATSEFTVLFESITNHMVYTMKEVPSITLMSGFMIGLLCHQFFPDEMDTLIDNLDSEFQSTLDSGGLKEAYEDIIYLIDKVYVKNELRL